MSLLPDARGRGYPFSRHPKATESELSFSSAVSLMNQHLKEYGSNAPTSHAKPSHAHRFAIMSIPDGSMAISLYTKPNISIRRIPPTHTPTQILRATWLTYTTGEMGTVLFFPGTAKPPAGITGRVDNPEAAVGEWNAGRGIEQGAQGTGKVDTIQLLALLKAATPNHTMQKATLAHLRELYSQELK